ncbi:hypothetical protein ACFFX0_16270 [Citricoccus parietis]|uniref:Uncharacterized protein n=1 Tax=Citricoccus parietis TaxID=592307 RepID=A0ABV5G160_9MICC
MAWELPSTKATRVIVQAVIPRLSHSRRTALRSASCCSRGRSQPILWGWSIDLLITASP